MGGWSSPGRPRMRGCVCMMLLLLEEEDESAKERKRKRIDWNRPAGALT